MAFSRRHFLLMTGTTAAVTLLPSPFRRLSVAEAAEMTDYAAGAWVPSLCNMCGGMCGILAYVENGAVRKIEPNGANPTNVANVNVPNGPSAFFDLARAGGDIGRLCCKGNSALRSVYDPDRIRTPLKRVGPRGSGQFTPISWQQAINEVGSGLLAAIQNHGARSIAWFAEDNDFVGVQSDLTKALGMPNFSVHGNLCDTSRKAHYLQAVGNDRPLPDMEGTDFLLVFGWNFLSTIKWIHLARIFAARREKGNFTFVVVDPVFNTTASKADTWIAPRPGTDGALALALCKLLIDNNKYNTTFVQKYTFGFDEFRKYLNGDGTYDAVAKTPAWAESVTGIPQGTITQLATDLGNAFTGNKKICIDAWSGPGHHTNATQGGRAIDCLTLLFGTIDVEGALVLPVRAGPSGRSTASFGWPATDGWRADGRDDVTTTGGPFKKKYAMSHGSGIYVEMRDAMRTQTDFAGNAYPIKTAVFVYQNFVMSVPNTQKNIDAINQMDFVVCVDTHLSETALLADIVIPGSNFLERFDFNNNWVTFRSVGLRQPVIPSWIGGLSECQFFLELGAALGLKGFKTTAGLDDTEENYNKEMWDRFMLGGWANQVTWAQLKQTGVWVETGAKGGTQLRKYQATGVFSSGGGDTVVAVTAGAETVYVVKNGSTLKGIATGASMADNASYEVGFATDTRRCQFWSPKLNSYYTGAVQPGGRPPVANDPRYHPLPYYLPPEDAPTNAYPYYFISWKNVEHTHTRTFNNEWLMEMKGENRVLVHPTAAAANKLTEYDWAWVQSPFGLVRARVHITTGIQVDTVGFQHGFGHWALGSVAKGKGAHDGWLLPGKAELHSGQAVHKEVGCRIYPGQ